MLRSTANLFLTAVLVILVTGAVTAQTLDWELKPVTARFNDAPLGSVLLTVAEKAGLSITFADELVEGRTVTDNFEEIPFRKVLDDLLDGLAVAYSQLDDNYIVLTLLEKPEPVKEVVEVVEVELNGMLAGKVIDVKTGEPLIGANVYFNNTMIGTATDTNGYFTLYNLKRGIYRLIVSYVGYEMFQENVRIEQGEVVRKNIKLKEKFASTGEVLVTDTMPKDWKKHLKKFEREFLGNSRNSRKCEIVNPEVLEFMYDDETETLRALTDEPLIIDNYGLGYRLHVIVEDFKHHKELTRYRAPVRYENLTPKNDKQKVFWRQNRLEAYKGSKRHFFRTLVNGFTELEGFVVENIKDIEKPPRAFTEEVNPTKLSIQGRFEYEYILRFKNHLKITYLPDKKERAVYMVALLNDGSIYRRIETFPSSWITIVENPVYFDERGILYDSYNLIHYGVWAKDRIGDTLPFEYRPPDDRFAFRR